ncbi:MAG: VWA domain-containing protein, partial [Deltaproteobacteria bacterium]|nr:VWA domain-containing protein [Deltaproteobacteria bacterium]
MKYQILTAGLAAILTLGGCSSAGMGGYGGGGDFGATQGGVQDMTLARSLVDEGKVPPAEALIVEAMFSEHDLPLAGEPCEETLCLRSALAIAPDAVGGSAAWVQVGMSSTIDPDTYVRPTQTIVATVDVSGSMGWSYTGENSPGALSEKLLHAIADRLHEGDRFAMVTFGSSSSVVLDLTPGSDQVRIHNAIDRLGTDGSTNMEAGMRTAYPLARSAVGETDEVRVMVFSDYQPNVGSTTPTQFQNIAIEGSEDGVGLTLFGLGLGLGPDVMSAMSEIRGANAFSLVNTEEVDGLMEDSWPWMVCPLAYDLSVTMLPSEGFTLAGSYGFPGEEGDPQAKLEVATVFLSRSKGAMLLELAPAGGPIDFAQADLSLSYLKLDGTTVHEGLEATYAGEPLDEAGKFMPQPGIEKTVALALLVSGMKQAAIFYSSDHDAGVALMESVVERFAADAIAI